MRIGIIGAGFTGLSAAYQLLKQGHEVTLFEKSNLPGGLAIGYKEPSWKWTLEEHYHHWFTNDDFILNLAKDINYPVITKRPKTSIFLDGEIFQLDSPRAFFTFSKLPLIDRLRMIAVLAFLRGNPFWKPLEKINANRFLTKAMGEKAYAIWETQLRNKMGKYADDVSLVWFWSRIKKRTPSLAYPEGGFLPFAQAVAKVIENKGGRIFYETEVTSLYDNKEVKLTTKSKKGTKTFAFDDVIITLPSFLFLQIAPQLPDNYKSKLIRLKGLAATNLVLRLSKPFLRDGTYWLSICEKNSRIMVIVEHTNFMDKKLYNNEHVIYIGNYPPVDSKQFHMTKEELLKYYDPLLQTINPDYKQSLIGSRVFKAPFAQPIVPTNYSKVIPPLTTPLPHVFLANIEQVYPWDRGTNYAVELGEKIANLVNTKANN